MPEALALFRTPWYTCEVSEREGLRSVEVRPIGPHETRRWAEEMDRYHYLGNRGVCGRSLRYVATLGGQWVALIGWGNAALKCGVRDRYLGWDAETKLKRLHLVTNNVRFLVLPWVRVKNLASRVLGLSLRRISGDYEKIYGHPVLYAETFVDISRYRGTCYRAANWRDVGLTRGYSKNGAGYRHHGQPKAVYLYPLHRQAREILSGDFIPRDFKVFDRGGNIEMLARFPVEGLMEEIRQIGDPRKARGIRHQLEVVLGIAVCAVLCGARGYRAIGDWATALRRVDLKRFGSHRDKAPSEPTIRRVIQAIDTEEFDRNISRWLMSGDFGRGKAVAIDGKTLRGSRRGEQSGVHLLSAVLHKEGIVIGQEAVDEKTNEITRVQPLVKDMDLEGSVVTVDALLTQREFAKHLVEEKKADYLFTVKGNQPTLQQDILDLELKKNSRP